MRAELLDALAGVVEPVVGEMPILKMCDRGLFDVAKREHLSTIVEEDA